MRRIEDLRAAVRRGVELLNWKVPEWRTLVKVEEFVFQSPCRCILGQVGDQKAADPRVDPFLYGKRLLGLNDSDYHQSFLEPSEVARHGFDWVAVSEVPILQDLWTRALRGDVI